MPLSARFIGLVHWKTSVPNSWEWGAKSSSATKVSCTERPKTQRRNRKKLLLRKPLFGKSRCRTRPSREREEVGTVVSLEHLNAHGQCSWPIGEPESEDFRFCGKEVVPGRPYCAYQKASLRCQNDEKENDQQDKSP